MTDGDVVALAYPVGVAFDGANILVANFGSNDVIKLPPSDCEVLGTFGARTSPNDISFDGANVWVSNYGSASVTKLRASDGTVLEPSPWAPSRKAMPLTEPTSGWQVGVAAL